MSLNTIISKAITDAISSFAEAVSEKHNIPFCEISSLWDKTCDAGIVLGPVKTAKKSTKIVLEPVDPDSLPPLDTVALLIATKPAIVIECKLRGIRHIGTKKVLLARLLGKTEDEINTDLDTAKAAKTTTKTKSPGKKKLTKKQAISKMSNADVVKSATVPSIKISLNKFDNFEHTLTGLVFDKDRQVIGKQNDDGTIKPLNDDLINECNRYKFEFTIPLNLNTNDESVMIELDNSDAESESDVEVTALLEDNDSGSDVDVE
jgi:hypothetical protein